MKARQRPAWQKWAFALGLALGALLFLRQVWLGLEAVIDSESVFVQPWYFLGAFFLSLLQYIFQVLAWGMLLRYFGQTVDWRKIFEGYLISFLPRYIPGSIWGYWSRTEWFQHFCDIDPDVTIQVSILEAWAFILTAVVVAGLYLTLESFRVLWGVVAVLGMLGIGLTGFFFPQLQLLFPKSWPRRRMTSSAIPWAWFLVCLSDVGLWLAYAGAVVLLQNAFADAFTFPLWATSFAVSVSWVLGFIVVILPGGLGVREVSLAKLLALYVGLPLQKANLIAVFARFEIVLAELTLLCVGIFSFKVLRRSNTGSLAALFHKITR